MNDVSAISNLASQVNDLTRFCARLSQEIAELRSQVAALSGQRPAPGAPPVLDREDAGKSPARGINRRAVGAALAGAAAGVVGASVLASRDARPASAGGSPRLELAAAEQTSRLGGMTAPAIVSLHDAPHITVNAALGNDFRVTLGGNRVFENPTGSVDGQRITFMIGQGGSGSHQVTWSDKYRFGMYGIPALSATEGAVDVLGFIYNKSLDAWLFSGAARGF